MRTDLLFMLKLICAVVGGAELPDEVEGVDWKNLYDISRFHGVTNLVGYGVMSGNYQVDGETKNLFIKAVSDSIKIDAHQMMAAKELFEKFDAENINYMPLKGINLKKLYPQPHMRNMSDCDILIRESQKEQVLSVMESLGYNFRTESNHELVFDKKPLVNIELHKYMIPTYTEDLYEYYGDGWKLAKPVCDGNRYALSSEDELIYIFAHMVKHYRDAGIGIKHMLDIGVFVQKSANLNHEYIKEHMQKLNMYTFYQNIMKLLKCWRGECEYDEVSMDITNFVLKSGSFGSLKNKATATTIRTYMNKSLDNASRYKYLKMVFPDYWQMKGIYPNLEKRPYLLPFYWIKRLVIGVLFKRKNIEYHVAKAKTVENDYVDEYKAHMETVGLDIYNGRKKN